MTSTWFTQNQQLLPLSVGSLVFLRIGSEWDVFDFDFLFLHLGGGRGRRLRGRSPGGALVRSLRSLVQHDHVLCDDFRAVPLVAVLPFPLATMLWNSTRSWRCPEASFQELEVATPKVQTFCPPVVVRDSGSRVKFPMIIA